MEKAYFAGLSPEVSQACRSSSLNRLMGLGAPHWSALRRQLQALLSATGSDRANIRKTVEKKLVPMAEAELLLPAEIGDYTDFYSSIYHATNVGNMFRPDRPIDFQLQIHAGCLPWPCVIDRRKWNSGTAPYGTNQTQPFGTSPLRADSRIRLRS